MQFEMGSGVAVDADGIIYLFTRDIEHWAAHPLAMSSKMGKSSISMFNREGAYLGKWGPSDEPTRVLDSRGSASSTSWVATRRW